MIFVKNTKIKKKRINEFGLKLVFSFRKKIKR